MKTWEMIKELGEDPKKKYEAIEHAIGNGGRPFKIRHFIFVSNDAITYQKINNGCEEYEGFSIKCLSQLSRLEWEEVKEPVDFVGAVESGKYIRVEHEKITNDKKALFTEYDNLSTTLYLLIKHFSVSVLRDIILNGKWYIK